MSRSPLFPISFHSSAHRLTLAMIVMSVLHALLGGPLLIFFPKATIYDLQVWRPFTSLLVAANPLEVIFGGLIIYSVGGALENAWGSRRFIAVTLGIPFIAELITLLGFILIPTLREVSYHGVSTLITVIWIAFGLRAAFTRQLLNFWGTPLRGETFALIGLGFVVLNGLFASFLYVLPDLFGAGLTYLYMYRGDLLSFTEARRRIELRYYNWKLRRLKNRSKFKVVKGSRDDSDEDTQYH